MTDYLIRLYRANTIEAELPLDADSDCRALAAALAVTEACDDVCEDFDLLREDAVIRDRTRGGGRRSIRPHELTLRTQERVVRLEERILASDERIAQSRRLLARTRLYKAAIAKERNRE